MSEADEVGEEIDRTLRAVLTAAGVAGEIAARRVAQRRREAAGRRRAEAAAAEQDLVARRDAARLVHEAVRDPSWALGAEAADVARAWEAAQTWRDVDPRAEASAQALREAVRSRWGLDIDALDRSTDQRPRTAAAQAEDLAALLTDRADSTAAPTPTASPVQGADSERAEPQQQDAADAREAAAVVTDPGARGYARGRSEELRGVEPAAARARLRSAPGFSSSTADGLRAKQAARARVARRRSGRGREHDLDR